MEGNGLKLCQGKFRLDIKKKFFPGRMVRQGNKLPSKVIKAAMAPGLLVFKKHLSNSLRYMV